MDGVLELKAFGSGPDSRVLGVRLVTWSDDEGRVAEAASELQEAVVRLVADIQAGG